MVDNMEQGHSQAHCNALVAATIHSNESPPLPRHLRLPWMQGAPGRWSKVCGQGALAACSEPQQHAYASCHRFISFQAVGYSLQRSNFDPIEDQLPECMPGPDHFALCADTSWYCFQSG